MSANYSPTVNYVPTNVTASGPTREPEVLAELTKLTDQCQSLNKLTAELEDRLKGVLSIRSSEANGPSAPEPVRVPLAAAFHDRVVALDNVLGQLSSLINRLEI